MTILIAKANEDIIKELYPAAEFKVETKNTSTFIISPLRFKTLSQTARVKGYNPTALMTPVKS